MSTAQDIAKDITIKAMELGKIVPDDNNNSDSTIAYADKVSEFYSKVLKALKKDNINHLIK